VLGATHPNELRRYGQAYRLSLEILATKNKLEKHVIFCNQFVNPENLTEFMGAADLYITPYLNAAQITSGTLSFAFGSGKAVVSTPYWHAADPLADGWGALVPFADSPAMAEQILGLLRDDTRRNAMRTNAYRLGRETIWSNVAKLYIHSFELARLEAAPTSRKSLAIKTLDLSIENCQS
jgi:glycosyltransferase involved in cell wall biosynthesis